MKAQIIGVSLLLVTLAVHAQRTQIFSLSPMARETARVNGMVLGFGHFEEPPHPRVINGVNIDLFALSPLLAIHGLNGDGPYEGPDSIRYRYDVPTVLVSNGVNMALGGYVGAVEHNGLSVGMYNICKAVNGLSVAATYNRVSALRGLHVAFVGNFVHRGVGVHVGLSNRAFIMQGLQLGIVNRSNALAGLQVGLFNRTAHSNGLQLGFVNTNAKRTWPFINF